MARTIARTLNNALDSILVDSIASARSALQEHDDIVAAVIDVILPDGNGLDLVEEIRGRCGDVPILVLTASFNPEVINRAHLLGAEYVCKPDVFRSLRSFFCNLVVGQWSSDPFHTRAINHLVVEHDLTIRQTQILAMAASGVPRNKIAGLIKVSENTLKSQIRLLLDKFGCPTLSEVVWRVHAMIRGVE